MEDVAGVKERPAESRVREAAALDGVDTLVVACPKDMVMFQDALKTTGLEGKLVVRDTMELVRRRCLLVRRNAGMEQLENATNGHAEASACMSAIAAPTSRPRSTSRRCATMPPTLPGVTVARDYKYMCSDPGQELIKQDIRERTAWTRMVVAACSPHLHEKTFRRATARRRASTRTSSRW